MCQKMVKNFALYTNVCIFTPNYAPFMLASPTDEETSINRAHY